MSERLVFRDGAEPEMVPLTAGEISDLASIKQIKFIKPISSLDFMERFTQAERSAIRRASRQNDALEDWLDLLRAAQTVDITDPRTIAGVQAMVSAGLLTQSRADEVLANA